MTASVRTRGTARILVWGLGHVGTVTAACLAENGHDVTAVDPDPVRVSAVERGASPVREPGLAELVASVTARGRMRAAVSGETLVAASDFSIVCVGTGDDPATGLSQVMRAAAEIGRGLRRAARPHVVILRSTVPPGTTRGAFSRALAEASGRRIGRDFDVVFCPEFLREGTALADFRDAPCVILGGTNGADLESVGALFAPFTPAVRESSAEEAELVKLAGNAFHSLKVGFSNEIGSICARLGVDAGTVMRLVAADRRLNASDAYLEPGLPFGGPCLGKDLRLLLREAARLEIPSPILESILPSNARRLDEILRRVLELGARRIALFGLAFKPGTDDLRESPALALAASLARKGIQILVHDPDVRLERLASRDRALLSDRIPDFERAICADAKEAIERSDAIVVTQRRREFEEALRSGTGGRPVFGPLFDGAGRSDSVPAPLA